MQAPLSTEAERTADGLVRAARAAARTLAGASSTAKDDALRRAADGMRRAQGRLLEANHADLERTRAAGESAAFLDRLTLTPDRIDAMAQGLEPRSPPCPTPSARRSAAWRRPNGLEIAQVRVPIGVVLTHLRVAPERHRRLGRRSASRRRTPCLLKGGSESQATSAAIADVIRGAVERRRAAAGRRPARRRRARGDARGCCVATTRSTS